MNKRTKCLVCNGELLRQILNLGMHGFADTFYKQPGETVVYPLSLTQCTECGHVQTEYITDPNKRYIDNDYSYTMSNSKFATDHWDSFCKDVVKETNIDINDPIMEIGSNDGYLLSKFKELGYKELLGIDASPTMTQLSYEKYNIHSMNAIFGYSAIQLKKQYKLVIANNVFNHIDDLHNFMYDLKNSLTEDGTFVCEFPYWAITVFTKKFDQIYHEHVSYFTIKSLTTLLKRYDMYIKYAHVVDYHGGSLRVYIKNKTSNETESIIAALNEKQLFDWKTYRDLQLDIENAKLKFMREFYGMKYLYPNALFVGIGAAAKANTLLTYYGLNEHMLNFITDASSEKQGKFTPLTNIPIYPDESLKYHREVYAIILSWNISDLLKENLKKINPNIIFLNLEK